MGGAPGETVIGLLAGIFISLTGAAIAIASKVIQDPLADGREQKKLISLVRGELLNIKRHCTIVHGEATNAKVLADSKIAWVKRKHGDVSFIKGNIAKLGFIDEETVADFFQLSLYIRNNDLEIDQIIEQLLAHTQDNFFVAQSAERMTKRMSSAVHIVDTLLSRPALTL